jgi:hypothetical protein
MAPQAEKGIIREEETCEQQKKTTRKCFSIFPHVVVWRTDIPAVRSSSSSLSPAGHSRCVEHASTCIAAAAAAAAQHPHWPDSDGNVSFLFSFFFSAFFSHFPRVQLMSGKYFLPPFLIGKSIRIRAPLLNMFMSSWCDGVASDWPHFK